MTVERIRYYLASQALRANAKGDVWLYDYYFNALKAVDKETNGTQ